jgi:hypothetical protein
MKQELTPNISDRLLIRPRNATMIGAASMMERDIEVPADDNLVGFFARHIVPVFFTFEKEGQLESLVMTTFVLSIGEHWFLVTAGHCIAEVDRYIESDCRIAACYLVDSMGLGARHLDPIPFVYARSYPTRLSEDKSFDYGVMVLSSYYRQLLENNKIVPLSEDVWKRQPPSVDFYFLLGVPGELVKVESNHVEIVPTLHKVQPVGERPQGFTETEVPLFYGRIGLGQGMTSIKGMSGGPIFAFFIGTQGQLRYWLIALQSRWLPDSHYIAACPTKILGEVLEAVLHECESNTSAA